MTEETKVVAKKATVKRKAPVKEVKRYCAYDVTLQRFVGAVSADQADAQSVIDNSAYAETHEFEIREV